MTTLASNVSIPFVAGNWEENIDVRDFVMSTITAYDCKSHLNCLHLPPCCLSFVLYHVQ